MTNIPVWPDPQPVISHLASGPYPIDALPLQIRLAVEEVQRYIQAPYALVAASALSSISLAGQAHYDIARADRLCGPVGLYFLVVADSGERKSSSDTFFRAPFEEFQARASESMKPDWKDYLASLAAWKATQAGIQTQISNLAAKGQSTVQAEKALRASEDDKPEQPREPRYIRTEVSPESLRWDLAMKWPSCGIVSAEGGVVFGGQAMGKDALMRYLATLNLLWDGAELSTDRRTSESFVVRGARMTMGLQVQEATLRTFLAQSGTLARGTGFLARFLIAWPESTIGYRPYVEPLDWTHLDAFNRRITALLEREVRITKEGSLTPSLLVFTPEAKKHWIAFHDRVERELGTGGSLQDVRDVASKVADNAARLAALFHTFGEEKSGSQVGVNSFNSASRIVEWHLTEAKRFFGELALPDSLAKAALLDAWLITICKIKGVSEVSSRNIQQFGPTRVREKASLDLAIHELLELDRMRVRVIGKRRIIQVNPFLLKGREAATATFATAATGRGPIGLSAIKNLECSGSSVSSCSDQPAENIDHLVQDLLAGLF